MRVTPEKQDGKDKIFEFGCAQSISICGHTVSVFDAEQDNVQLKSSATDEGTWLTLPKEKVEELKGMIESDWTSLGDGRTEDLFTGFVLDGYGDYFYFGQGFQALRSYLFMGGQYKTIPKEEVPKTRAVLALFRRCAVLLQQNGVDRKYFSLVP